MNQPVPRPHTPYIVGRPQASDAVGCALRNVYAREDLPNDLLALVRQLDGIATAHDRN